MKLLQQVIGSVLLHIGNEIHYFKRPVEVELYEDFTHPIYGICVAPFGELFVMDKHQRWNKVEDKPNDLKVISTLATHLKKDPVFNSKKALQV